MRTFEGLCHKGPWHDQMLAHYENKKELFGPSMEPNFSNFMAEEVTFNKIGEYVHDHNVWFWKDWK